MAGQHNASLHFPAEYCHCKEDLERGRDQSEMMPCVECDTYHFINCMPDYDDEDDWGQVRCYNCMDKVMCK